MRRYALRDDQWDRIKDILPGREGHVGVIAQDKSRCAGRSPATPRSSRLGAGQALWTACGHTPAMKARDMLPYYGTAIPSTCGLGSMISAEQA